MPAARAARARPWRRALVYIPLAIAAIAIIAWLFFGRDGRVPVMAASSKPCAAVTLESNPAREVIAQRLKGRAQTNDALRLAVTSFAVDYLHASMSGCAESMIDLRLASGDEWFRDMLRTARRGATFVDPEHRPPNPERLSDRDIALWWFRTSEPWAWVDLPSLALVRVQEDAAREMMRRWRDRWAPQTSNGATGPAPEPYFSIFLPPGDPEDVVQSGTLFVLRVTFGLRAEAAGDDVLRARVILYALPDGTVGVLRVLVDGNLLPLWPVLVL